MNNFSRVIWAVIKQSFNLLKTAGEKHKFNLVQLVDFSITSLFSLNLMLFEKASQTNQKKIFCNSYAHFLNRNNDLMIACVIPVWVSIPLI